MEQAETWKKLGDAKWVKADGKPITVLVNRTPNLPFGYLNHYLEYKENNYGTRRTPGDIIGIDVATALSNAYSASTAYGHASAGKDLVLSMNAYRQGVLGANNTGIVGVFIELRPNKKASVLISKV